MTTSQCILRVPDERQHQSKKSWEIKDVIQASDGTRPVFPASTNSMCLSPCCRHALGPSEALAGTRAVVAAGTALVCSTLVRSDTTPTPTRSNELHFANSLTKETDVEEDFRHMHVLSLLCLVSPETWYLCTLLRNYTWKQ